MSNESEMPEPEEEQKDNDLHYRTAGTVVYDRYTIVEMLSQQEDHVVYAATEGDHLRWCPSCEELILLDEEDEFCDECGTELSPGQYRLVEWLDGSGPPGLDIFVQTGLAHEAWVSPQDSFIWEERWYMVQANREGDLLDTVSSSATQEDIISWGITLASGLESLHEYGFAGLKALGPKDMIVTENRQIKLCNWQGFSVYPVEPSFDEEAWADAKQQDLMQLASLLTVLLIEGETDGATEDSSEVDPTLRTILSDMAAGNYAEAQMVVDELEGCLKEAETVDIPGIERSQSVDLHYDMGCRSDVGQIRPLNEDSLVSLDLSVVRTSHRESMGLYAVADGIGGHDGGEVASRVAVGTMAHTVANALLQPRLDKLSNESENGEDIFEALLIDSIHKANEAVLEARNESGAESAMGTTVTAALVIGSSAYVANVGDSRTYLFRQEKLVPVTTDHSVVARLVAIGMIQPDEVYTHPQRSVVYRALGEDQNFQVDTFIQPLLPEDALVICSDGLWEKVKDPAMETILSEASSSQEACDTLVAQANANGGEDNISVIVLKAIEYRGQDH